MSRRNAPETFWSGLRQTMERLTTVIVVVGLIMYAAVRGTYEAYYAQFEIKPGDVGVGQVETIQRAAFGTVFAAAEVAVLLAGLWLLFAGTLKRHDRRNILRAAAVTIVVCAGSLALLRSHGDGYLITAPVLFLGVCAVVKVVLTLLMQSNPSRTSGRRIKRRVWADRLRQWLATVPWAIWISVVLLFVVCLISTSIWAGTVAGEHVREYRPSGFYIGWMLDISVQCVSTMPVATGPNSKFITRDKLLYLGKKDGQALFFDTERLDGGDLVAIPIGSVIVQTRRDCFD